MYSFSLYYFSRRLSGIMDKGGCADLHSLPCGTRDNLIPSLAPGRGLNQVRRIVLAFSTQGLHDNESHHLKCKSESTRYTAPESLRRICFQRPEGLIL